MLGRSGPPKRENRVHGKEGQRPVERCVKKNRTVKDGDLRKRGKEARPRN